MREIEASMHSMLTRHPNNNRGGLLCVATVEISGISWPSYLLKMSATDKNEICSVATSAATDPSMSGRTDTSSRISASRRPSVPSSSRLAATFFSNNGRIGRVATFEGPPLLMLPQPIYTRCCASLAVSLVPLLTLRTSSTSVP